MPPPPTDAELIWPGDIGKLLDGVAETVDDKALLAPAYRAHLICLSNALFEGFDELTAAIRHRLWRPPFFTVLRGITFDAGNLMLAVLASRIGRPLQPCPDPGFTVIRELRPAESARSGGWGALTEWLHTDSANWPTPHDVTLMLCRRPDQNGGGATLVLPLNDALAEILESCGLEAIDRLSTETYPWAIDASLGGGATQAPVLSRTGIRWQLFTIAEAARAGAECAPQTMTFLQKIDQTMRDSGRVREFTLADNDLMIINNRHALHARRAVPDPERSQRALLRCKVNSWRPHPSAADPSV